MSLDLFISFDLKVKKETALLTPGGISLLWRYGKCGSNDAKDSAERGSPIFNLIYRSESESALLNVSKLKGNKVKLHLTDISGRILFVDEGKTIAGYFSKNIPMDNFAAGIYLVTIVTEKEKLSGKIVKE